MNRLKHLWKDNQAINFNSIIIEEKEFIIEWYSDGDLKWISNVYGFAASYCENPFPLCISNTKLVTDLNAKLP